MIARVLAGDHSAVVRPRLEAGTMIVFRGRENLHRVTPVGAQDGPRVSAIFNFSMEDGGGLTISSAESILEAL